MTSGKINTILITGGCGFIGKQLAGRLRKQKNPPSLIILDNHSAGTFKDLSPFVDDAATIARNDLKSSRPLPCVSVVTGDVDDSEVVRAVVERSTAIVHLAAHTNVTTSLEHPESCFSTNIQGVFNLFESARHAGINRIVFASSNAAVGEWNMPLHEDLPARPISPYGATKLFGESMVHSYVSSYGMSCIALRFANVYGSYSLHKSSVAAKFLKNIISGTPLTVYGDGKQTRDYVNVNDILDAIETALLRTDVSGVFQIGTGKATSILEFISILEKITGRSLEIVTKPERRGEIVHNLTNPQAASRILDFKCKTKLEDGLADMWRWMLEASQ